MARRSLRLSVRRSWEEEIFVAPSFLYEEKCCKKTGRERFVEISAEILGNVEIFSDFVNGLIETFVEYRCDVELFGEESRRLRLTVVERRVESEVSSPSFPTRTVLSPRRARTSSRRLFPEGFALTLNL